MEHNPKLVYIMGAGRSGSTLLGIALGNLDGVFYAGELVAWNHFRGRPLGGSDDVMRFWEALLRHVPEAEERYFPHDFVGSLEHVRSLARPRRWYDRALRAKHAEQNRRLIDAIVHATGASTIVDSSHYPLRALLLRRIKGLDVFVVHLVRDPRQVINALQKHEQRRRPMHPLLANVYCITVAALAAVAWRRFPRGRRLRVRYEDFVSDPAGSVEQITDALGLTAPPPDFQHLEPGLVFQGNRLRLQSTIAVAPRDPEPLLSPSWRRISTALQLPLLLGYGYVHPPLRARWRS